MRDIIYDSRPTYTIEHVIHGVSPVCNYFRFRKIVQTSSELNLSLLEIDLCLTLMLTVNLKHILPNGAVIHVLEDHIICVEESKGYGEALRSAKFDRF